MVWTTATDPSRSSFEPDADRITRDPASIMLALSRTVIFDHREGTAVLLSSIMFFMGAFTLIELIG